MVLVSEVESRQQILSVGPSPESHIQAVYFFFSFRFEIG